MDSKISKDSTKEKEKDQLEWLKKKEEEYAEGEFDFPTPAQEGIMEKFKRKSVENPFVPIGCLGTGLVLSYGLWCFRTGQTKKSQIMMRARIGAQGFTVAALIIGLGLSASSFGRKSKQS